MDFCCCGSSEKEACWLRERERERTNAKLLPFLLCKWIFVQLLEQQNQILLAGGTALMELALTTILLLCIRPLQAMHFTHKNQDLIMQSFGSKQLRILAQKTIQTSDRTCRFKQKRWSCFPYLFLHQGRGRPAN